jgi:hypothetical protein
MQETIPEDARRRSEESESKSPQAVARPIWRLGIGFNVVLQVLLAAVLLGTVNYLAFRHYERWDLTRGNHFTLSSTTTNFLVNSDTPIEIVVAFVRDSALAGDVINLVEEYKRQAPQRIDVSYVDPARDRDRLEEVKLKYGLDLRENVVIIAAGESARMVAESSMLVAPVHQGTVADGTVFLGEDALTSAMISVTEGSRRKLYILAGKGQLRQGSRGSAYDLLASFANRQNAVLEPLRLEDLDAVPEDADGLILVNAMYDLTGREIDIMREYWERRRGGVLLLLNPEANTPRLDGFLSENGITPRQDRVLYAESTGAGSKKQFQVQSTFVPGSRITEALWGLNTTFGGQTCSLEVREEDEDLRNRTIEVKPLLEAAARFWGETSYLEKLPTLGPGDNAPPIFVAASAELGALADERLRIDSSRMVVVGNATVADPDMRVASNSDFIGAALNWLLDREELIGIAPKIKQRHHVDLSPEQHQRIFWICAITFPAAVAAFGFFVWAVRRV